MYYEKGVSGETSLGNNIVSGFLKVLNIPKAYVDLISH